MPKKAMILAITCVLGICIITQTIAQNSPTNMPDRDPGLRQHFKVGDIVCKEQFGPSTRFLIYVLTKSQSDLITDATEKSEVVQVGVDYVVLRTPLAQSSAPYWAPDTAFVEDTIPLHSIDSIRQCRDKVGR